MVAAFANTHDRVIADEAKVLQNDIGATNCIQPLSIHEISVENHDLDVPKTQCQFRTRVLHNIRF